MLHFTQKILILSIAVFISACSEPTSSIQNSQLSQSQVSFCKTISTYKNMYISEKDKDFYIDQKEKIKHIYNSRTEKLKTILGNGKVDHWQGIIKDIIVSEGKGAYLEVQLSCDTSLEAQDSLIIAINSPLYQELRNYSENSNIIFSGTFLLPPDDSSTNKYPHEAYYGEKSFTENGSMKEPEFLFMFTQFHKN
jgi:hypothetical protein